MKVIIIKVTQILHKAQLIIGALTTKRIDYTHKNLFAATFAGQCEDNDYNVSI